jgi:hypothetical protein
MTSWPNPCGRLSQQNLDQAPEHHSILIRASEPGIPGKSMMIRMSCTACRYATDSFFLPLESAAALPDVLGPPLFSIIGI